MSLDGYVFSNKILKVNADLQISLELLGFRLRLIFSDEITTRHGHLPAIFDGREAGFECGPTDLREIVECYNDFDLGGPWTYAYEFHWSTLTGCLGAWMSMAAYADATDGIVFDPQDGVVLTARAAAQAARSIERDLPRLEGLLNR